MVAAMIVNMITITALHIYFFKSKSQISFIGPVRSKDYYIRASGVICEKYHIGVSF